VVINPAIQPYFGTRSRGQRTGDRQWPRQLHVSGFPQRLREHFGQGRLDYNIAPTTSSSPATRWTTATSGCRTDYPQFPRSFLSRNQFFTGE